MNWLLLGYDKHRQLRNYVKRLNHLYTEHSELWQVDYSWEGFQWIVPDDNQQSVIAFLRRNAKGKTLLVVCNFNPVLRSDYKMGVPVSGSYAELMTSDDEAYGGSGIHNGVVRSKKGSMHGFDQYISLTLPPMSTMYFTVPDARRSRRTAAGKKTEKKPAVKKAERSAAGKTADPAGEKKAAGRKPAARTRKAKPAAKPAAEDK